MLVPSSRLAGEESTILYLCSIRYYLLLPFFCADASSLFTLHYPPRLANYRRDELIGGFELRGAPRGYEEVLREL